MFSGTSDNVILRALGVLQLTSVMRKSLTALTAATAIAAAAIATLTDARWRGAWWGPALGGFALGALFGSAFVRITVTGTATITWATRRTTAMAIRHTATGSALLRLLRRTLLTGRADKREP
jgi:hypothetical protein